MKRTFHIGAINILLLSTCSIFFCTKSVLAQSLVINSSNPKQKIVTPTGTLDAATLNYAHFPKALGIDSVYANNSFARKILLSWYINIDNATVIPTQNRMSSLNGGTSWGTVAGGTVDDNVNIGNAIKLKNGRLIALPFKPTYVKPAGNLTYPFDYYTSINNGDSWTKNTDGVVDFSPLQVNGLRFHEGMIEEPDGSLYAPAYVSYTPGTTHPVRTYLLKSMDGGKTWKPMPNATTPLFIAENTNEGTISRCTDGSWLVVMRQATAGLALLYSRSSDKGLSWSLATTLPGLGEVAKSVDPKLMLMPNGVMVLTYGRPNLNIAFSMDGSGYNWSNNITTYVDADETRPTSANSTLATISHNKILQFGDYYAATYNPNTQGIWQKEIGVRRSDLFNRIDLSAKYANNNITVTTDLNYSSAGHPEARVAAVFDGSTDYWSGAFKQATTGYYLIDLQQAQTFNTIGICLAQGLPQSATIKYSLDNISYTTIKTYNDATHYALDYTTTANFVARYIKVELNSNESLVGINEIQLFSVEDTFDEDDFNKLPYGYTAVNGGFWVSKGVTPLPTGYQSSQALYMSDEDAQEKVITKTGFTPFATKTLEFYIRTKAFAVTNGAIQWRINSGASTAYQLRVIAGGTVQYFDGTTYQTVAGVNIPADTWTKVKVVANATTGNGEISINGGTPITISKLSTFSGASLDGFSFASGGAVASGDKALFDDASFYALIPGSQVDNGLPIELKSFVGKSEDDRIRLNWSTASEKNNARFDILRSVFGTPSETIGTVVGNGNSAVANSYTFVDRNPITGVNYYQLKQVDFDGKFQNSKIIAVKSSVKETKLTVRQGEGDQIWVNIYAENDGPGRISVSNISGNKLAEANVNLKKGYQNVPVTVRGIKPGVYIVMLNSAGKRLVVKFVK